MIINQIAHTVFDSFADSDIVVAILNHNGSYVSNNLDVFEKVFSARILLDELCSRIDDGQEPLITHIDGFRIAACGISAGFRNIGYAIMLLPGVGSEQSFEHIEIILEQLSLIAGLIEQNQQLKNCDQYSEDAQLPAFASVN